MAFLGMFGLSFFEATYGGSQAVLLALHLDITLGGTQGDHMERQGLNSDQLCPRQALYSLCPEWAQSLWLLKSNSLIHNKCIFIML